MTVAQQARLIEGSLVTIQIRVDTIEGWHRCSLHSNTRTTGKHTGSAGILGDSEFGSAHTKSVEFDDTVSTALSEHATCTVLSEATLSILSMGSTFRAR